MACDSQEFIATLLFDPSISVLAIAKQNKWPISDLPSLTTLSRVTTYLKISELITNLSRFQESGLGICFKARPHLSLHIHCIMHIQGIR